MLKLRRIVSEIPGNPLTEIALEEAILRDINDGLSIPALRLWRCNECIVLGASRRIWEDLRLRNIREDSVPIIRRSSGGGTVYHHPDNLCYSLYLPYFRDELTPIGKIRESIQLLCGIIVMVLKEYGFSADISLRSDIRIDGRKVSGTAQQRLKNAMCHHGTILFRGHIDKMEKYLTIPKERSSAHSEFVGDLISFGIKKSWNEICNSITMASMNVLNVQFEESVIAERELERANELVEVKYSKEEWTYRFLK